MGMIPVKCPSCGADIQLDDSREFGFCTYCGTKIVQDKIIVEQKVTIKSDNSEQFNNYMTLARREKETQNIEKARDYYQAALLINPNSWEAVYCTTEWNFRKGINSQHLTKIKIIFELISNYVQVEEQREIYDKIIFSVINDFSKFFSFDSMKKTYELGLSSSLKEYHRDMNNSYNRYERNDAETKYEQNISDIKRDYRDNLKNAIASRLKFGDFIQEELGDDYSYIFVELWKDGINIVHKAGWYDELLEENKIYDVDIKKCEEKIKKYDSNYSSLANEKDENKNDIGCYVATAVYGSYDCPEVWTLRRFRDNQLAKTWYGRLFIHTYYAISPTLVKWFGNTQWFKNMWKPKLDKMVDRLQKEGVENTPYQDKKW